MKLGMSVPEVAKELGLSRKSTYSAIQKGEIPSVKIGGRIVVPRAALLKMLEVASEFVSA